MKNICIIGPPGTGKTTLANFIACKYKCNVLAMDDIDKLFLENNNRLPNKDEWLITLKAELNSNNYSITEGFYKESLPYRFSISDVVIYYNIGTLKCLWFAFSRGIKNLFVDTSAHPITRISFIERLKYCFLPRLYWRILTFNRRYNRLIELELDKYLNIEVYKIKSRNDVKTVLNMVDKIINN